MKRSTNYNLPLPEGEDEMLIEEVSEGIDTLDTHLGSTESRLESVIALCNEFKEAIAHLNRSVGNAYLKDEAESVTVEIIRKQYKGHSEYTFFDIRCIGCRTSSGDYIFNTNGAYITYGSRWTECSDFTVSINPKELIVTPITAATLDNILYVEPNKAEGYEGFTILSNNDPHDWIIGEEEGYDVYDTLHLTISLQ